MDTIVWTPSAPEATHMWKFMRFVERKYRQDFSHYQQLHRWSIDYPELFWPALCEYFALKFDTPPQQALNQDTHLYDTKWFSGARLNFAEKLLSREDNHTALIGVTEDGQREVLSYTLLKQSVSQCAEGLKQAGIQAGDRVAALMPNVPATIIAMLATASLGAVWSSCSPDFGVNAVLDRLGQIQPKVLIACDIQIYHGKTHHILEKVQQMVTMMPSLQHIVIYPMQQCQPNLSHIPQAVLWHDFLKPASQLNFVSLPFDHPLYILFSSGTTGQPKCIIHSAGGTLLQHIKELGLHTDLKPEDNMLFYTTCGWMMWNWMVSSLALGTTLTLYEGSPTFPDNTRLLQCIDEEGVSVFGTSAKFISTLDKADVHVADELALQKLRCILSTGSPLLPKHYDYVCQCIKPSVQLCSISGGSDIISCFALGNPVLPVYRGELQSLGLGMAVDVYNEEGESLRGERGELVCTQPFPSMPVGFWNDPDRHIYRKTYFEHFPKVWSHGDFAEITEHGGLIIYGRSDAVLNPGGVRIGTAEIYRQVEKIHEILECVAIGQDWQDDVRIVLFVKLRPEYQLTQALQDKIRQMLRDHASPRHVPAKIIQVNDIPRTINGKIVEVAVRRVIHHQDVENLKSLSNPESLSYFKDLIELQS